jgi:hypothetical protein
MQLLDPRTGSVNLRPQYCVPLPFYATTKDTHRMLVEARVQFSLNRDLMKYVYQIDNFGLALETRIHSAFRAEIGLRNDEDLRASLAAVEAKVIERLRQAEGDGDDVGEAGLALGVNFHTASFTYTNADDQGDTGPSPMSVSQPAIVSPVLGMSGKPGAPETPLTPEQALAQLQVARAMTRSSGVLSLRPQTLDVIADVFKDRDPASTQALLALLEMQTRQNIAEALAASGGLVVVTTQEIGLGNASAQFAAMAKAAQQQVRTSAAPGAPGTPSAGAPGALPGPKPHS